MFNYHLPRRKRQKYHFQTNLRCWTGRQWSSLMEETWKSSDRTRRRYYAQAEEVEHSYRSKNRIQNQNSLSFSEVRKVINFIIIHHPGVSCYQIMIHNYNRVITKKIAESAEASTHPPWATPSSQWRLWWSTRLRRLLWTLNIMWDWRGEDASWRNCSYTHWIA